MFFFQDKISDIYEALSHTWPPKLPCELWGAFTHPGKVGHQWLWSGSPALDSISPNSRFLPLFCTTHHPRVVSGVFPVTQWPWCSGRNRGEGCAVPLQRLLEKAFLWAWLTFDLVTRFGFSPYDVGGLINKSEIFIFEQGTPTFMCRFQAKSVVSGDEHRVRSALWKFYVWVGNCIVLRDF